VLSPWLSSQILLHRLHPQRERLRQVLQLLADLREGQKFLVVLEVTLAVVGVVLVAVLAPVARPPQRTRQ